MSRAFSYTMQIRRKIFRKLIDDKAAVKALGLLYFFKYRFRSSAIKQFSYNKLKKLTGLHIVTLRKYIRILRDLGFAVFTGRGNNTLLFKGDYSKDRRKNVNLDALNYDSVKDVANSIYSMFVVEEQRRKDFVKHVILISTENATGVSAKECIAAAKLRNRNRYGKAYRETGISYKNLARRLKIHTQKSVAVIKYACLNSFLHKQTRKVWELCEDAFIRVKLGIDYVCAKVVEKIDNFGNLNKHVFGYRVQANTYKVANRIQNNCTPFAIPLV